MGLSSNAWVLSGMREVLGCPELLMELNNSHDPQPGMVNVLTLDHHTYEFEFALLFHDHGAIELWICSFQQTNNHQTVHVHMRHHTHRRCILLGPVAPSPRPNGQVPEEKGQTPFRGRVGHFLWGPTGFRS